MMKRTLSSSGPALLLAVLTALSLASCSRLRPKPAPYEVVQPAEGACGNETREEAEAPEDPAREFNLTVEELTRELVEHLSDVGEVTGPVAVATLVDLNNLYRTSPFGRYMAEALMGELQRAGIQVTEIRKSESILIKERFGEYALSRNIDEISKHSSAEYVLVGTYVTRGDYVMLNVRLVSNRNSLVVSSASATLRRNPFLDRLLWPSSAPVETPRVTIPIKALGEETEVRILPGS